MAVLQITANGKASLVPIAILINGKFWDATAYKATPVPMALESGTVYEAYHAGTSKGLFTVGSALHSNSANVQAPWIGIGKWMPAGSEVASTAHTAESVPLGIDTSDDPPRLTKNPSAKATPPASNAPASTTAPSTKSQPSETSSSGDGPPRLKKPAEPTATPPADSTESPKPTDSKPEAKPESKPTDTKPGDAKDDTKADAKPTAHANVATSDSGASRENRPTLRRGKPAESFADEDVPGYSKPGASPAKVASSDKASDSAPPSPVQIIPAISDANGPELRSFTFEWLKGEEDERRQQMLTYAKEQIRAYVDARAKAWTKPAPSSSVPPAKTARKTVTKLPEPILENAQMVTYDLWTNNQPVLVFAADAHMPPPSLSVSAQAGSSPVPADPGLQYTIMLVARTDIYNNLHKLFIAITDKNHLDVTPRLELIDAVDADGDSRGELLFRETSDAGTGWILYRANADKLWKIFDSLNPE